MRFEFGSLASSFLGSLGETQLRFYLEGIQYIIIQIRP